jgi:hypothetical protein
MLGIAAREADIVGINPRVPSGVIDARAAADATAAATDRKVTWLRDAAGDHFDDLELNALVFAVIITDDAAGTAANMAPLFGVEAQDVLEMPHALIGTVDEICERLHAHRERWGFSYFVVQEAAIDAAAPIVARLTDG